MTQHVERTRDFPQAYGNQCQHPIVSDAFVHRPGPAGVVPHMRVDMFDSMMGPPGQPFAGMDPSQPATWIRYWNPAPGMIGYLNFDGAKLQGDTPMGGTWRNPMRDRKTRRRR